MRKATDEQKSRAAALFKDGVSVGRIAIAIGVSLPSVTRWLDRAGLRESPRRKVDPERDARIVRQYSDGVLVEEICERHDVSRSVVVALARRAGLPSRHSGPRFHIVEPHVRAKIVKSWNAGKPAQVIGTEVGLNPGVIRRVLLEEGIQYEARRFGDKEGRWHRGAWRMIAHGYVYVRLLETDPLFCMANGNGYVLEHRYVMAKKLKRPLTPDETVHHIDSDKTNNKPRNLQLRKGKHGKHSCYACADCGSRNIVSVPLAESAPT